MSIREDAQQMKLDAPIMAATGIDNRNDALRRVKEALLAHADEVFAANAQDLTAAQANEVAPQIVKRLRFDEHKLADVTAGIDQLVALPDPVGRVTLDRELDEGLELRRVTCPIGVIGVIFEARPDALVQISTLCLKSGNCAILKGGRETTNTNRVLFALIHDAAVAAGLPDGCLKQAESHADIDELLACDREVDLLIPRGSNAFVRYIMDHTKIPVMGHSDGICHMYIDAEADQDQALRLVIDAKTQYVAACNALETCLVDRAIAPVFLPRLASSCADAGVVLHGDDEVRAYIPVEPLGEDGYRHEYLDMALTVALVDGVDAACDHINRYGSHHTARRPLLPAGRLRGRLCQREHPLCRRLPLRVRRRGRHLHRQDPRPRPCGPRRPRHLQVPVAGARRHRGRLCQRQETLHPSRPALGSESTA